MSAQKKKEPVNIMMVDYSNFALEILKWYASVGKWLYKTLAVKLFLVIV